MYRRMLPLVFLIALFGVVPGIGWSASEGVVDQGDDPDCTNYTPRSDGVYIQSLPNTDVTGGLAGLPGRVVTDVSPGERARFCVGFHNRTGRPMQLRLRAADVGVDANGAPFSTAVGETPYGAGAWIQLPRESELEIAHGDIAWFDVGVDVPMDTSGGSNYAAVIGDSVPPETTGGQSQLTPTIAVQVFFDVDGEGERGGRIEDVRSPRVVWWDGLHVAKVPFLDDLRGPGIAPIRFRWENRGDFSATVGGDISVKSDIGGKEVAKLGLGDQVVLRSAERSYEATWSDDIPIIGRFTPTIELRDGNGNVVKQELPAIWVIPSWWYLLALVVAVAIPVTLRRRSRRRYRDLEERVAAAEAGSAADDDEWDDEY